MKDSITGIDEAGRGPWAGPIVAAAVNFGSNNKLRSSVSDSKSLSPSKRNKLYLDIIKLADSVGIGWVSAREIDKLGLTKATKAAMNIALEQIRVKSNQIIIDGNINYLQMNEVTTVIKADSLVPQCSAASIIAKVARDNYMKQLDIKYADYGFSSHFGYGTKKHVEALKKHGPSKIHRKSFKPIEQFIVD